MYQQNLIKPFQPTSQAHCEPGKTLNMSNEHIYTAQKKRKVGVSESPFSFRSFRVPGLTSMKGCWLEPLHRTCVRLSLELDYCWMWAIIRTRGGTMWRWRCTITREQVQRKHLSVGVCLTPLWLTTSLTWVWGQDFWGWGTALSLDACRKELRRRESKGGDRKNRRGRKKKGNKWTGGTTRQGKERKDREKGRKQKGHGQGEIREGEREEAEDMKARSRIRNHRGWGETRKDKKKERKGKARKQK